MPIDKPLPSTIGVPNLLVTVVSIDTWLTNCIEGSNRDRSILPRVYGGRQCLSEPVVSIDYSVPPRQAKDALEYQPITNDEELIDTLRSANVFQHVSETPRRQRLYIARDSFNNKSASSWTGPDWSVSCLAPTTGSTESPKGRGMR